VIRKFVVCAWEVTCHYGHVNRFYYLSLWHVGRHAVDWIVRLHKGGRPSEMPDKNRKTVRLFAPRLCLYLRLHSSALAGVSHSVLRPLVQSAHCTSPVQPKVTKTSVALANRKRVGGFTLCSSPGCISYRAKMEYLVHSILTRSGMQSPVFLSMLGIVDPLESSCC